MNILIHKDANTKIARECGAEQAQELARMFEITVVNSDGTEAPLADLVAHPSAAEEVMADINAPSSKAKSKKE